MKSFTNLLVRVVITVSLIFGLFSTTSAQSKKLLGVQDYTSIAQISGTADGQSVTYKNPYTSSNQSTFAGTFNGTLNGNAEKFYCIDLQHYLEYNADYWDEGSTPPEMTYILNNYFPFKTSYTGKLSDNNKEASAVQLSIWHFSDGVDANTVTDATIKARALAIISDASANYNSYEYLESILIIPPSQSFVQGTTATFDVYTTAVDGSPLANVQVQLSTTLGTLSSSTVTTDANGHVGPLSLSYSGLGTATISAKADLTIPQGTRYVHKANANGKQKLVLATPSFDKKEVTAKVTWYTKPGTNDCDLKGYTTFTQGGWGSPSNSAPGKIRDMYFSTVFPSGLVIGSTYKLTLTSATAVKNFLPQGSTAGAFTQNYTDATSTSAGVLAGQLVALKLNAAFDAAGKLGSNSTNLGDLAIATGPFMGMTVNAFLALAEQAIGGGSLNGHTFSEFNNAATSINENFDNGTVDKGFLSCMQLVCKNTVGSYVYRDKNANGTKDTGELGIAGAVVELVQGTTVLATATTNANGQYSFPNLLNGTYTVRLAASNFASGGVFFNTTAVKWYTKNSTSVSTTLNCNDNLSINFGYYKTCIGITKTADKTTYKPGDVITYTITVENCGDIQLHGGVDVFDNLLWGTTAYHIDVIESGQTFIIPVASSKYTVKTSDCGNLMNTVRAEGHPVDGSATVIAETSVTVVVDCTLCKNTVGSYVYRDKNANGTKDTGELGIAGAVVELVQGTTVIATATTDANGHYSFPNLVNGTYTVRLAASNFASGGVFFNTAAVKWYTKNSTSVSTTLNCNDNLSINFGYYKTCIGITKTADKTTYKVGDVVTYTITVENCGDIQLHGGVDVFDNLLWGTTAYHIDVIEPGQTFTIPIASTKYTVKTSDCGNLMNTVRAEGHPVDGSATVVAETSVTVTVDCTVCKNTVGSYVYRDLNVNGTKDSGEPGIAGAVVELVQGTTVLATATTDANGHYSFPNLLNGTYTVRLAASNFASGGVFFNTAQVKWYTKNSTSVSTTLNCNDNLSINFGYYKTCVNITKSSDKQSYNNGETITYSFIVENCGDVQLHGGIDVFDAMLKPTGDHLIKHIDVLDPHQSTTFTYTYVTSANDCGQLVNTVRAEGHPVDGSLTVVDESSWTVNVICQEKADIKIEKLVDNPNPNCDDFVTFTIKATNLGPNTASGIIVTDLLPSGLNYVSSTASQGTYNSTTGIWTVGNLASGAFATLTIKVKVDCGQVNNSAFDFGTAKDYNLFVIEDASQPSADTQGKVAVGRDAQFSNYSIGDQLPSNSGDVLIVGRDLTYTSGAIYNGNVVYGHATNLPLSGVSITGGTLRKDSPINFAAAKSYLENLSTSLAAETITGTTAFQWGGITLTGSDPFLNVFAVSGSSLSSANNVSINVPNGSVVLVNISGTSINWTGGLVVNGTAISNVLYNFYQATSLTISGIDIKGSALAPFAAVNFISGVINGQMICKSLTGMGQFNHCPFGGHIPVDKKITNVATITSSTLDPNPNNNSSSATITIAGTTNGNDGGNNGNGGTWTNLCSFGQGEIVYTLAYSSNAIFAGTWGGKIYKSTDGGNNWIVINSGMNVSFIWSLNITGGVVFAATEKGVYKYNGTTWILTSLSGKDVHAITSYNGILYAGTWGFGVFKSTDLGGTWTEINNGFNGFLAIQALTITSNGHVFAGTAGGGVFKCTDGMNWNKLTCGYEVIWSLTSTSSAVFAGTYGDGLYKSTDGGLSFTKVISLNVAFVYSMSVDLSGKIYVSSLTNGVFVSSDNGSTWTSLGMSGYGVSAMMVNPSSDDVYVGTKSGQVYKISGSNSVTDVNDNVVAPAEYKLGQNYPNPFNPSTTIEFAVPTTGMYALKVYNVLGQEVANLVENELTSGLHKVTFDASKLASGMYIYKLTGNNVNISKKMLLMK